MRQCVFTHSLVLIVVLAGCSALTCTPTTIEVASKDERPRLQSEPWGLRTDEVGRVKEQRREVIVTEYWVQDREGRWYRVGEPQWRAAEPGQPLQVCR